MQLTVNGERMDTSAASLFALRDSLYPAATGNVVAILDGFQAAEDLALSQGCEVVLIEKGVMPPPELLERMMAARHTPGVHQKLKQARVAVAGLGGLGSNIALHLARIGVGCLHLVDFDVVEPSNLNRQQYRIAHLGKPKAEALAQEIAEINPFVVLESQILRVTGENAAQLFGGDEIVCEAFDNPVAKAVLVNTLLQQCPQVTIVAASGMAGYNSSNEIRTQKLNDRLYLCGDGTPAQVGRGLMAPRVSICAGHQANMVLRLILGETTE